MVPDPDADEIEREREHRRADARRRIDGERVSRRAELERLRRFSGGRGSPSDAVPPTAEGRPPSRAAPPAPERREEPDAPAEGAARREVSPDPFPAAPAPRAIGAPIRGPMIREFLNVDAAEGFDIEALNLVRTTGLVDRLGTDPTVLAELPGRVRALMVRVKQEVDDPLSAGAFLRERVLYWYRHSAADPGWSDRVGPRWAGLFADSRVSGGRLQPWINSRLRALEDEASGAGRLPGRLRRGFLRDRSTEQAVQRSASQQIQAEVAQAILDDLARRGREPEVPLPLVRLSELAVRRQVTTINDSLAVLFNSPEGGPFVVLHPNRYPDCEEMVIRPPVPGAAGAALAYALLPGRSGRKGAVRLSLSTDGVVLAGGAGDGPPHGESPADEVDASTIWEAEKVDRAAWVRAVDERRRERRRLDPPPKEFRVRPAFAVLKELILADPEFRKAFLAARWRGRPTGLPLLVALLQKGKFVPEASTDHEYLESELGEWVQGDPQWRPTEPVWTVGDWTIRRDSAEGGDLTYRAERSAGPDATGG